jgi:3-methyladenine DNA glycosylase AlkD
MQVAELLRQLERAGTAQNRKVYARHGVTGDVYGVSYANLNALTKKIGVDQPLARALWKSGVHDARVLATMIADPDAVTEADLDRWVREVDNPPLTDALATFVARTRFGPDKAEAWKDAGSEWIEGAGWEILARLAGDPSVTETQLEQYLATIERDIHRRANLVRYSMNSALIAIGGRSDRLRAKALAAAKRIGKVDVDHGETECKTPDAAAYVEKVAAYRAARAKGESAGAAPRLGNRKAGAKKAPPQAKTTPRARVGAAKRATASPRREKRASR